MTYILLLLLLLKTASGWLAGVFQVSKTLQRILAVPSKHAFSLFSFSSSSSPSSSYYYYLQCTSVTYVSALFVNHERKKKFTINKRYFDCTCNAW